MKQCNYKIDEKIFKNMLGKIFIKYKCDPFTFTNMVYSVIGLYIGDDVYQLKNEQEFVDYFGNKDDIGLWNIKKTIDIEIDSALANVEQINTPIDEIIDSITLINENQQLYEDNIQTYDVWLTRAIIFHTKSRDICFEKDYTAFSEDIEILRGNNLVKNYPKENDYFLEDWNEGILAKCHQEIITLK